jgi:hypothetical protein
MAAGIADGNIPKRVKHSFHDDALSRVKVDGKLHNLVFKTPKAGAKRDLANRFQGVPIEEVLPSRNMAMSFRQDKTSIKPLYLEVDRCVAFNGCIQLVDDVVAMLNKGSNTPPQHQVGRPNM